MMTREMLRARRHALVVQRGFTNTGQMTAQERQEVENAIAAEEREMAEDDALQRQVAALEAIDHATRVSELQARLGPAMEALRVATQNIEDAKAARAQLTEKAMAMRRCPPARGDALWQAASLEYFSTEDAITALDRKFYDRATAGFRVRGLLSAHGQAVAVVRELEDELRKLGALPAEREPLSATGDDSSFKVLG